jgi:hypothetical protein
MRARTAAAKSSVAMSGIAKIDTAAGGLRQ